MVYPVAGPMPDHTAADVTKRDGWMTEGVVVTKPSPPPLLESPTKKWKLVVLWCVLLLHVILLWMACGTLVYVVFYRSTVSVTSLTVQGSLFCWR